MVNRRVIKKLEVSDFRGLNGTRTLDFEGADIVLLLGLNGFGKTSIFDSIEWCLTGKLGRYEQYNEVGRKQDFGKEKEVLRNKYATAPNTYVKLELEDGSQFGRKVVANGSDSDYNIGTVIDGFNFGLDAISKETINSELANSYFSATHILSQETINHFVTSKKPEERYQALSVNFGTAIFSPFERNIHLLLSKIVDRQKSLRSNIQSKNEIITTLKAQLNTQENTVNETLIQSNSILDSLNEHDKDIRLSKLRMEDSSIYLDPEYVSTLSDITSRTKLRHTELKEQAAKLHFLKENHHIWLENHRQQNTLETLLSKQRQDLSNITSLKNNLADLESKLTDSKKLLESKNKQVVSFEYCNNHSSRFEKTRDKVSNIERRMILRNQYISKISDGKNDLNNLLGDSEKQIKSIENNRSVFDKLFKKIHENTVFIDNYESSIVEIQTSIDNELVNIETVNIQKNKMQGLISTVASIDNAALLGAKLKQNSELFTLEHVSQLENIYEELISQDEKIAKLGDIRKELLKEKELKESQFSESKKLLSLALSQLLLNPEHQLCPVCSTQHKTEDLVNHIGGKLEEHESDVLSQSLKILSENKEQLEQTETSRHLSIKAYESFKNNLNTFLSDKLFTLFSKTQENDAELNILLKQQIGLKSKYEEVTALPSNLAYEKPFNLKLVVEKIKDKIEVLNIQTSEAIDNNENILLRVAEKATLVKDERQLNESDLLEIAILKDTEYMDMLEKLKDVSVPFSNSELSGTLNKLLSESREQSNFLNSEIEIFNSSRNDLLSRLKEYPESDNPLGLNNTIKNNELNLSKLKESLNKTLDYLSQVNVSQEDYSFEKMQTCIAACQIDSQSNERFFELLEKLTRNVDLILKYNLDNKTRDKAKELNFEITDLEKNVLSLANVKKSFDELKKNYPSVLKQLIEENLDIGLFNQIYTLLNPHRRFKMIDFNVDVNRHKVGINFNARHANISARPEFLFSSAQLNTFGICMFLSMALRQNWLDLDTILIDDPIQNLDDINILSFIDFLRSLLDSRPEKKQIILSTHDERFYDLMKRKFKSYNVKSFRYESYGSLVEDN
jgi:exonuclease SbcC